MGLNLFCAPPATDRLPNLHASMITLPDPLPTATPPLPAHLEQYVQQRTTALQAELAKQQEAQQALQRAYQALQQHMLARNQEINRRTQQLEALYRADEELYRHLDMDDVLQTLVKVAVDLLQADKSGVMVWDKLRQQLVVQAIYGFEPSCAAARIIPPEESLAGMVAITGIPAIVEDTHRDARVARHLTDPEGIRAFMHMPIKVNGQIYGVYNVDYVQPRVFSEDDQRLFMALAQRAALAIENARLYERAQYAAAVEERTRLARELHDAVTQTLFSATLIADVLPRLWLRNPEQGQQRLADLRELTRGALAEMRTLLLELRPASLTEMSLDDLLRQLTDAIVGRARLPIEIEVVGRQRVPAEVQVAFYRIAQESLNNIVKHAAATQVAIRLVYAPEAITLSIKDNGRGFDVDNLSVNSLGLGIMRERAAKIGANLTITSQINKGACITVVWPIT